VLHSEDKSWRSSASHDGSNGRQFEDDDRSTRWVAVHSDITERTIGEETLRRNAAENRKLAMVAKATENAVIIADVNGQIEWVNDAFTRLTGYELDEVKSRSPGSFLAGPDTDTETTNFMRKCVHNGEGFDLEILNYTKDRQPFWVAIDCRPVHDDAEMLAGFIAIEVDVTSRRRNEDASKRLNAELTKAYEATIEGWARALDLRDHETEGHSRRVTEMTVRLARAMGVPEAEIVHIRRGALLHDIGKIGVPDAILRKPGPLTDDEWKVMHQHPGLAKEMLRSIEFLQPALDIPYGHHERWDGSGYPQRLCGNTIPLAARIFAVVDIWDALSNDRPYRTAWPDDKIFDYIQSIADDELDPNVVSAFLKLFGKAPHGNGADGLVGAGTASSPGAPAWFPAEAPDNEAARLDALYRYEVLDSRPESAFDDLVRLAARICDAPMATISLLDADRQWFKARVGVNVNETPRDHTFCAYTILHPEPTIVPDAAKDPRFAGNPLVLNAPMIRYYAGVPLIVPSGHAIGTLCVLDRVPRNLPADKIELLQALSRQAVAQLELRRINNDLKRERQALTADVVRLGTLAATDPLTGLANRRRFDEALSRFSKRADLRQAPLSIILADADKFKSYNDKFGHPAGDEALRVLAKLLRLSCRRRDLAARYGGEEFAVLLPGADGYAAKAAAVRIQAIVSAHPWPLRQLQLSIGVATMLAGGCAIDLIERADAALYRAKSLGRNCIVLANSSQSIDSEQQQNGPLPEIQLVYDAGS
jgi:diguanylate cyclase (GGDEF)-like protein/PAS domain S-box-containing protein/putative nucleotidyltransferase with HDIG domain